MKQLRAVVKAALLLAVTIGAHWSFLLAKVCGLTRRGHRWRNACFRWWATTSCRILSLRALAVGTPPQDVLIVTNHVSYVDIILLASFLDAVFVAKSDVAGWPVMGSACRAIDTIFIDRNSKRDVVAVGEEMEKRLAAGLGVVFFPEGTSSSGEEVLPFRTSLFEVAARDRIPVHYATIRYSVPDNEPPVTQSVAWWGEMGFVSHAWNLVQLSEITAEVVFGDGPIIDDDRKQLAVRLHAAVSSQLQRPAITADSGRPVRT